jgi:NADH-quinone oxidoreductase subunit N
MNWDIIFVAMLPEHLLLVGIVLLVILEMVRPRSHAATLIAVAAVGGAAVVATWLCFTGYSGAPFDGQLSVDPWTLLAKAVALALALPVLLLVRDEFSEGGPVHALLLSSLYGLALMLSSDSFLTLFLGLEMMSLPVYVLVLLAMRRPAAVEGALKYLVLGGAASATLLMGVSMLYGQYDTLLLAAFKLALGSTEPMAVTGTALVLAAFFLKAAIVPFHTWAPDAYEGASLPVTAYMAAVIKAGVLLAVLRLFGAADLSPVMTGLLTVLPLVSIVWGNLAAMRQDNLRRMMAYSSIGHAGYLYLAFLGTGYGRFESVLFYVIVYGLMTVLAFAAIPAHGNDRERDGLSQLAGLFQRQPFAAIAIGLSMLSLAGIPPLPGFVAKFLIFRNVMAAGHTVVAVLGLVGSYLGLYFYLRVIQAMFMTPQAALPTAVPTPRAAAMTAAVLCLAPALAVALFPGWVLSLF